MLTVLSASGPSGYRIANSLRFRSSASAYLSRTPASAGNRKTWTLSLWNKGGNTSNADYYILSTGGTSAERFTFTLNGNGGSIQIVQVVGGAVKLNKQTTAVYRDPSAWYHILLSVDTTQSTPSINLYVNGVQVTAFSTNTNTLAQNADTQVNNTNPHYLSKSLAADYLDGYMAEINFIDGQALTPSSFGETNVTTGVWQPKQYTGSYGTNGFKLNFSNGTSTTTLGYDSSGNGNNWTTNNISLTAGSTYDWMIDSPTKFPGSSYGVGNYATLNPLFATGNVTNANLTHTASAASWVNTSSTFFVTSGKWYFEATNSGGNYTMIGVATNSASTSTVYGTATSTWTYFTDGTKYGNGAVSTAYGASYGNGDVIGVALDMDAGTLTFYKNNVSQGVAFNTGLSGLSLCPWFGAYTNGVGSNVNFGQRPFAYTPPSGYKSLCTQNLPGVTIQNGAQYMAATLYTGNGATNLTVANANNSVSFQPGFVWIKKRGPGTANHCLNNEVMGVGTGVSLYTASTSAAGAYDIYGYLSALTSTGFTTQKGTDPTYPNDLVNESGSTYVAWQWKAGGTAVTNTAGSITSSVSANQTAGFSVVTYTGNGNLSATVGHGLSVVPAMIIDKGRSDGTYSWRVYHQSITAGNMLLLNSTSAAITINSDGGISSVGASTFGFAGGTPAVNATSTTYVAYCFAAIPGYSAFGSYTGNGSADGPFVYCGFRPRFILIKNATTGATNWLMDDTSRGSYNVVQNPVFANASDAEQTSYAPTDILCNGFKVRAVGTQANNSGDTFIYAAFCEVPMNFALAR